MSVFGGTKPDITPAQVLSTGAIAAAVLLSHYGWMTTEQFFGVVASGAALKFSDAGTRIGRNVAKASENNLAAQQVANLPVEGDDSVVATAKPAGK